MLQDKAMIIIAVSKYAGAYDNLPGAITSARRLREWAEDRHDDCSYNVLYLADDVYEKIDVQLVREKVTDFVSNNFIDRLVVYFAGHGIVRSAGDQFWLLTDAANDLTQGINVEAFRRGLLKCNIGNADLAGQLCIIGDACRNTGRDAIEFYGDPILTLQGRMNRRIQLDRFLSTGLGDYSFQINQTDNQAAYCLFSEVMLSALRGEVKEAIETEFHPYKPVVTNHKLAEYLEEEVRIRAAAIQEDMEPDLLTGIHPPYNFYKRLSEPFPDIASSSQDPQLTSAVQMAISNSRKEESNEKLQELQEDRKKTLLEQKQHIASYLQGFYGYYSYNSIVYDSSWLTVCDFHPSYVAIPRSASLEVHPTQTFKGEENTIYELITTNCHQSPILILQGKQWIITPNYPNVFTVIFDNLPGDVFLFSKRSRSWDTYLSDFSNLVGSIPLRAADAQKFADRIRVGKEEYPHQAVTAGYLYEFSNDYDNIARTAHYMAWNTEKVPFDLALLCADKIWWNKENGRLVAFADLPAVEPSQTTDYEKDRPYFARRNFKALKNVELWGIAPIFRQGWNFMQTELYLEIPEEIRLIGENMNGRSAASLTDKGLKMFLKAFDYRVIDTEHITS